MSVIANFISLDLDMKYIRVQIKPQIIWAFKYDCRWDLLLILGTILNVRVFKGKFQEHHPNQDFFRVLSLPREHSIITPCLRKKRVGGLLLFSQRDVTISELLTSFFFKRKSSLHLSI